MMRGYLSKTVAEGEYGGSKIIGKNVTLQAIVSKLKFRRLSPKCLRICTECHLKEYTPFRSVRFRLYEKAISRGPLQLRQIFEKGQKDYINSYLQLQNPDLEYWKRQTQPNTHKEWNGNLAFMQHWDYPYIKDYSPTPLNLVSK